MPEWPVLKNPKRKRSVDWRGAGCCQFSRSSLIQVNVRIVAIVGTIYLPAIAGFGAAACEQ
jgi:hypothetical protein